MLSFRTAALGLTLALSSWVLAKPPFLKVFADAYKVSPTSALGKARCLACHQAPAPPRLNPFGRAVEKAMGAAHARMLTPEILKKVEKADADKDGASNVTEIRAGTLPGDKASKPAKRKVALEPSALVGLAMLPFAALAFGRRKTA